MTAAVSQRALQIEASVVLSGCTHDHLDQLDQLTAGDSVPSVL